jgi:glycosyltransferase involved in cell wall biosynthesis
MNILVLYHQVPFPPTDGGSVSIYNDLEALHNTGNTITLICFNTSKNAKTLAQLNNSPAFIQKFNYVYLDNNIQYLELFISFFSGKLYNIARYKNHEMKALIRNTIMSQSFDIVMFEGIFMHSYLPLFNTIKIKKILRPQNVEHVIFEKLYQNTSLFSIKKLVYFFVYKQFKSFENEAITQYNAILPLTKIDADYFKKIAPNSNVYYVTAIRSKNILPENKIKFNRFFHLGSMDWHPNIDGVKWWITDVYPLILKMNLYASYHFAGKNMPKKLLKLNNENLIITGFVADAVAYMQANDVLIVPLKSGSGYRIKILEAFDLGIPVIATSQAIEGIEATPNVHFLLADTAEEFAMAIKKIHDNSNDLGKYLAKNAKKMFDDNHNLDTEMLKMIHFINSIPDAK